MRLQAGDRFRELTLLRCLGEDGTSAIWLARDDDGHKVALRIFPPVDPRASQDLEFRVQLGLAQCAQHPGVARVIGGGLEGDRRFALIEFVDGVDLGWILRRAEAAGHWPAPETAAAIMARVARGLAAIHQVRTPDGRTLLHRCLSPSKILLDRSGAVKIADFLSAPVGQSAIRTAALESAPHAGYLSPELASEPRSADQRSDLFALGAIFWELLTRQPLFRRANDLETLAAITATRLPEPPDDVPAGLLQIARHCLAKLPSQRPVSASEVAHELETAIGGHPDALPERIAALIPGDLDTAVEIISDKPLPARRPTPPPPAEGAEQDPFFDAERDAPLVAGGRFEILGRIGEGGMGEVYRARDRELNELIALKILNKSLSGDREQVERMRREVRVARRISSARVCRIFDIVELEDGNRGLAMELIKGRPLSHLIWQGVAVDHQRFARWGADLAEGLAAAHALGIVHRDLKPDNVMIDDQDRAVILDFGVAYTQELQAFDRKLTRAGVILGTLPYMAPEQLTAAPLDGRADLYALGLILAELICGEVPFSGTRYDEVLQKRVVKPEPFHPKERDATVPAALDALIAALLESNREQRPASAEEVMVQLRAIARGETQPVPLPTRPPVTTLPPPEPVPPTMELAGAAAAAMAPPELAAPSLAPVFVVLAVIAAGLMAVVIWLSRPRPPAVVQPVPVAATVPAQALPGTSTRTATPIEPAAETRTLEPEPEPKLKPRVKERPRIPKAEEM